MSKTPSYLAITAIDHDAYMKKRRMQQGREAFQADHPIKYCPFDGRTQDGRWWRIGWTAAADAASAKWWEWKLGGKKG